MPVKAPIYLKTPTDRRGRKLKLRDFLSGDMISPPLGDLRHSAHVGPRGLQDAFGDVSFLRGQTDMLASPRGGQDGHGAPTQAPSSQDPSVLAPSSHQDPRPSLRGPQSGQQPRTEAPSSHHSTTAPVTSLHNGHGSSGRAPNSQQDPYPSLRAPHSRHEPPLQAPPPSIRPVYNGQRLSGSQENCPALSSHQDTLPSLRGPHSEHRPPPQTPLYLNPPAHPPSSPQDPHTSPPLTASSLALLISQEQAPPKPPRLHLTTPPQPGPAPPSLSDSIRRLVPSSASSSEDSLFEAWGPPWAPRGGLSLHSDCPGLSSEDLRGNEGGQSDEGRSNEGSPTSLPPTDSNMSEAMVTNSDLTQSSSVMAALDLDLGPSIMDDVLSIMDRYGAPQ